MIDPPMPGRVGAPEEPSDRVMSPFGARIQVVSPQVLWVVTLQLICWQCGGKTVILPVSLIVRFAIIILDFTFTV
jgi:hypothetical protein